MSEFDDLVAECGIAIVDPSQGDGGDVNVPVDSIQNVKAPSFDQSGDASTPDAVQLLEDMFSHRYTSDDKEYMEAVADEESKKSPPCIPNFREKRSRGNFNNRGQGRGGGDYNRGREDYGDNRRSSNYNRRDNDDYYRNRHQREGDRYHRDGGDDRRHYNQSQCRDRERL